MPGTNQLSNELLSISGIPADGILEAIVGDSINWNPAQSFAVATITLNRRPAGSAAVIAAGLMTADVPGFYLVTVAAGGFSQQWLVGCLPASTLLAKVGSSPYANPVSRTHIRALLHDPRVTQATLAACLEVANPFVNATIVGGGNFSWAQFGN